jgi:hypothetical protein
MRGDRSKPAIVWFYRSGGSTSRGATAQLAQQKTRDSAVTAVARSAIGAPQWAQPSPMRPARPSAAAAQLPQQ